MFHQESHSSLNEDFPDQVGSKGGSSVDLAIMQRQNTNQSKVQINPTKVFKPNNVHLGMFMGVMILSGCAQNYIDYSNAADTLYDA